MLAEFLYNPSGSLQHAHSASIALTPQGDILIAWYAYPGPEDYRGGQLVFTRKLQSSPTFEGSRFPLPPFDSSLGNPVIFVDSRSGTIHILFVLLKAKYWQDSLIFSIISEDLGESWSKPISLHLPKGYMIRHPPIQLNEDKWLLPAYDEISLRSIMLCGRGHDWKETYRFDDFPLIQPVLLKDPEDRLSLFFRPAEEPEIIWRSHSTDWGNRWSQPIKTALLCPLSGISGCANGKKLLVFHNPSSERKRFPLAVSTSIDGGITWREAYNIDSCMHEVSYPSFITDSRGFLHGVYTYNRRMIKYVYIDPKELP